MKKYDLISHLMYMYDRTSQPTYNQLESGFRHSPLRPKEIEERKDDCLREISDLLRYLIDTLEVENIEND